MAEAGNCEPDSKDSSRPKRKAFLLGKLRNAVSQPNRTNQHLGIEGKMDRVISLIFQMLNEMQKEIAGIKQHLQLESPVVNEESSEYQEPATTENTEKPIRSSCREACYNQPATEDHIFCISRELVKDWKPLLTQLGLTQADVDIIDTDIRGCEEKVREALVRWRQTKASSATVERLLTALNNIGRRDVSEILKKSIDDDFTGTTPLEVKYIMEFFSDCIELWKKNGDKEMDLFNQLESLESALEQIEQDSNGGTQNAVDLEDCWAQSRAIKNIIVEFSTVAGELVKANNPLVMEKVFDLLIRVRDGSNCMAKKLARLEERKADMEEDDQEELAALGKRCLRLKEIDELRKRFEDSWGEKWLQLQLQKTQSEPPMSRKEWQAGRKVRREHTVHALPNSSGKYAGSGGSNPQSEDLQVLYQFRQYILRMIKEEHS